MPDWWIGRKHSEETKRKMSLAKCGVKNNFYGKKHKEETKNQISLNRSGKCVGAANPVFGTKRPEETRKKISTTRKIRGHGIGEKNNLWRGGTNRSYRDSKREFRIESNDWREDVLEKADYTCNECGVTDCVLVAHHKKDWVRYPELRFRVSNGECLCTSCHNRRTVKETKQWQKRNKK